MDIHTLLVAAAWLFGLNAVLLLWTWAGDRREPALALWSGSYAAAAVAAALFAGRGTISDTLSILVANLAVQICFGTFLAGALRFERRSIAAAALVPWFGAAVWLAAWTIPAFRDSFSARVTATSLLIVLPSGVAAAVFWTGWKREPLPSRRPAALVAALVAATHVVRAGLSQVMPVEPTFPAMNATWMASIGLQMLLQGGILVHVLLSLVRERNTEFERRTAERDPLTGAFTRAAFFERAAHRLAAIGTDAALLVFDLDRFKSINDTHGHAAGDRVLESFGAVVAGHCGEDDVFGRHGGEEFVLLVSGDLATATHRAEEIRSAFAAVDLRHEGRPIAATVSIGVSSAVVSGVDLSRLLAAADSALYAAKSGGRDRVETVDVEAAPTLWSSVA